MQRRQQTNTSFLLSTSQRGSEIRGGLRRCSRQVWRHEKTRPRQDMHEIFLLYFCACDGYDGARAESKTANIAEKLEVAAAISKIINSRRKETGPLEEGTSALGDLQQQVLRQQHSSDIALNQQQHDWWSLIYQPHTLTFMILILEATPLQCNVKVVASVWRATCSCIPGGRQIWVFSGLWGMMKGGSVHHSGRVSRCETPSSIRNRRGYDRRAHAS